MNKSVINENEPKSLSTKETFISPSAFTPATDNKPKKSRKLRPVTVVLLLVFGGFSAVMWFLLSAKSVYLDISPTTASVRVNGLHFLIHERYLLLEGAHDIQLEAEGYHPYRAMLTIDQQQEQTHRIQLKKLPGSITVDTQPTTNASIWIDGSDSGVSGKVIEAIEAGEHQLTVHTDMYKQVDQIINITGMEQHQKLTVSLEPAWADVTIETQPAGAEISFGNNRFGTSPLTAKVKEGTKELQVTLSGHKTWIKELKLTAGEKVQIPLILLEKSDGLITLSSKPSDAGVTLNGQYLGQTPIELQAPPGKTHQLVLFKEGFHSSHKTFSIDAEESKTLALTLQPIHGQIKISGNPVDALLYIDDRLMGRANQTITLPTRKHSVRISKEGYVDYVSTFLPRIGFDQEIKVELKTIEQAKWENIKTTIIHTAGPTLKLFKSQKVFTMGSSRREQGRRANETHRRITLTRPFYLGISEITNTEYRRFDRQHSSGHVKGNSLNGDDQPVVNVSWQQAALYCNWLSEQEDLAPFYEIEDEKVTGINASSNGYRLPTEAEWAWSARYKSGEMLKYQWGSSLPLPEGIGNVADRTAAPLIGRIQSGYEDGFAVTAPVTSFKSSGKGLFDLTGNVAEWINDIYEIKTGLSLKMEHDPIGIEKGDFHVIRGASWAHGSITELRLSYRDYGIEPRNDVGFRIARYVEKKTN